MSLSDSTPEKSSVQPYSTPYLGGMSEEYLRSVLDDSIPYSPVSDEEWPIFLDCVLNMLMDEAVYVNQNGKTKLFSSWNWSWSDIWTNLQHSRAYAINSPAHDDKDESTSVESKVDEWLMAEQDADKAIGDLVDSGEIEIISDRDHHWQPQVRIIDVPRAYHRRSQDIPRVYASLLQLIKTPYRDYLKTDHWKLLKSAATEKACGACQVCATPPKRSKFLHVHHRTYERKGYERLSDLIVLCSDCHQLFHDNGRLK